MTTEDFEAPAPAAPLAGAGLNGGAGEDQVPLPPPAPGGHPAAPGKALPAGPVAGGEARPSPPQGMPVPGDGRAQAPSPSQAPTRARDGEGRGGGEDRPSGGVPSSPSPLNEPPGGEDARTPASSPGDQHPASGGDAAASQPLAGQDARKAWQAALSAKNARQRRDRQRPWTAKGKPGYQSGANRRLPPPQAGGAA